MEFTDQQVFDWLQSNPSDDRATLAAMQQFGVSPEQVARVTGLGADAINSRIEGVVNNVYNTQFGRGAEAAEIANAWEFLNGGGQVDQGIRNLNNTQEGYNYDTQDIIAAYRQATGLNPTQEQYVSAMATLGLNNFDRGSLGGGKNTTANVAALESDPYAGRYAGYNPYDLPADAVNVSTNILGDQVQFTNPVTQRPMVASFENGNLVVQDGVDTMTGAEAAAAVGLAMATGGMNQQDYSALQADLKAAKSMDDVYAAFSNPKAVVTLDPTFGMQTGVGKTREEAQTNGAGMNELIAELGLQTGGNMPSNTLISNAAKEADVPYQFDQGLYDSLFSGQKPSTQATKITPANLPPALTNIQGGVNQFYKPGGINVEQNDLNTLYGGWKDSQTVGASDGTLMGAGNADYNSSLIKSLRQSSITPFSSNPGVMMAPNQSTTPPAAGASPDLMGGAFNPQVLNPRAASGQEVADWNAYSTYRTNALNAKTPILSMAEWLAGGKSDGKAPIAPPAEYDYTSYGA